MQTAQQIINQMYVQLDTQPMGKGARAQLYYNIISVKQTEGITDIYLDIKHFIRNYVYALDEQNYNYDRIDSLKIMAVVNALVIEQKIAILDFLRKIFIRHQCEDNWDLFASDYYQTKLLIIKVDWYWLNPVSLLKLLHYKMSYSRLGLFMVLGIFVLLDLVLLYPNPWGIWMDMFKVDYRHLSDSFLLNHVMNVLLGLFEFDIDFKVLPLNFLAMLLLIFAKSFKILLVIGYIVDKIIKRINFND